ncbi:MAG: 1-acyl-sn-glycerol-3-phosphate acyltransferase [Bacteroidia bacterium]|jgi:1-acyl-sn-glycerol-3-phosphate acyltransferase
MGRFFYWLANFLWFKIGSWKVVSLPPKDLKKAVLIATPHTAKEDFPVGIGGWYETGLNARFIAKKSLFEGPMGFIFRSTGGVPIDRKASKNMVQQAAAFFDNTDSFFLTIAPDGTREWMPRWKTGFYYIAKAANVPIVLAYMDFGKKEVGMGEVFYPTDDEAADFKYIEEFYKDMTAKIPANYNPKLTDRES